MSSETGATGGVDHDDLVKQFSEITGVDQERARFYLEASGWQLQVAMGGFYEGGETEDTTGVKSAPMDQEQESPGATSIFPRGLTSGAPQPKTKTPHPPQRGGLMTLDALRQQHDSEDDSSDEDANKQAFYAGGSSTSGQQVLGPAKKRDELIADMFKKAREHGAEEVEAAPQMLKRKTPGGGGAFGGAGYKLGETESEPAQVVGGPSASSDGNEVRNVVLRLWSQGFTIDGGELRSYLDPANMAFLNSVKRGEVPRELLREFSGQEVSLTMEDRRTEDYAPPKPVVRPFAGKGQMLGSPAPSTVVSATGPVTAEEKKAAESSARGAIKLADGEATTNIQLRLLDGSRLVATFNPSHTVQDLHSFINTARPEYSVVDYVLTLFPNKQLNEKNQSLKDAQVLSSALIQKLKQ